MYTQYKVIQTLFILLIGRKEYNHIQLLVLSGLQGGRKIVLLCEQVSPKRLKCEITHETHFNHISYPPPHIHHQMTANDYGY